jgi:hypothetical protein
MVDILAAVALKCRWTDCNRELDLWKDFNINLKGRCDSIRVLAMLLTHGEMSLKSSTAYNSYLMNYELRLRGHGELTQDILALAYAGTRLSKAIIQKQSVVFREHWLITRVRLQVKCFPRSVTSVPTSTLDIFQSLPVNW